MRRWSSVAPRPHASSRPRRRREPLPACAAGRPCSSLAARSSSSKVGETRWIAPSIDVRTASSPRRAAPLSSSNPSRRTRPRRSACRYNHCPRCSRSRESSRTSDARSVASYSSAELGGTRASSREHLPLRWRPFSLPAGRCRGRRRRTRRSDRPRGARGRSGGQRWSSRVPRASAQRRDACAGDTGIRPPQQPDR